MLDLEPGADPVDECERIGAITEYQPIDEGPQPRGHGNHEYGHHGRGGEQRQRSLGYQAGNDGGESADDQRDQQSQRDIQQRATQNDLDTEQAVAQYSDRHRDRDQAVGDGEQHPVLVKTVANIAAITLSSHSNCCRSGVLARTARTSVPTQ